MEEQVEHFMWKETLKIGEVYVNLWKNFFSHIKSSAAKKLSKKGEKIELNTEHSTEKI